MIVKMKRKIIQTVAVTTLLAVTSLSFAAAESSNVDLSKSSTADSIPTLTNPSAIQSLQNSSYTKNQRNGMLLPGEVDVRELLPSSGEGYPPPYGANLFAGGYESERTDGLNDNYLIAAGDKINIWLWGAVNYADVPTVDTQGNIFIPNANIRSLVFACNFGFLQKLKPSIPIMLKCTLTC